MKKKRSTNRARNNAHLTKKELKQLIDSPVANIASSITQPAQSAKMPASTKRTYAAARMKTTKVTARTKAVARRASKHQDRPTPKALASTLKKMARRRLRNQGNHRPTSPQYRMQLRMLKQQRCVEKQNTASLGHKTLMRKKRIAARRPKRYTYLDCMRDEVPVPTGSNGTTLFQALMVGGMTAVTVTVGGVSSDGVSFLVNERWLYPMMFSISFLVRLYISMPIISFIDNRFIEKRLRGVGRNTANVMLGTAVSSPITSAVVALLFNDANGMKGYAHVYLESMSAAMPLSILVSLFLVGPFAKLIFNNRIKPVGGLRVMRAITDHAASIARMFGF